MDLYIIGAGNVGGFIAYHIDQMGQYTLKGLLDDDPKKHGGSFFNLPVLGATDYLSTVSKTVAVAIAIADPIAKATIFKKLRSNRNVHFPNFIHPNTWMGSNVIFGKGNIIYPGTTINYEAEIHDFVTLNMNASIGHNCEFHNFSTCSPGVKCGGFTTVKKQGFLGIGACTLQSTSIGEKAVIGAGAVIIRDIPDQAVVVGNPGKINRYRQ